MKKIISIVLMTMLVAATAVGFTGCGKLSAEEQAVIGKYEVTSLSIDKYPAVSASTYDYFTMEFFTNRKCIVKNGLGVTVYEAEATWKMSADGDLEITTRAGLAKAVEKYKYEDGVISGTNEGVIEGERISMTISLKKVVEAE